jgi:hypothetical protein
MGSHQLLSPAVIPHESPDVLRSWLWYGQCARVRLLARDLVEGAVELTDRQENKTNSMALRPQANYTD